MAILQAIFLGIIEGLTEFLPISSTGHLIVSEKLIGYKDSAEIFTVVIQIGAIAAVLWYYRKDILDKIRGLFQGENSEVNFWKNYVIATIPAGLAGLLIEKKLNNLATLPVVASALILGGIAILLIERSHIPLAKSNSPKLESISTMQAFKVGCYQVLALIPGVSRSGATIMGGLLSGLDRLTATAFSFYLSIPIMVIASGYKLFKDFDLLKTVSGGGASIIIGTITSFVTALFVINWLLKYVSRHNFKPFAYYRIILGIIILLSLTF